MSKSPHRNQFGDAHTALEGLMARAEGTGTKYPVPRDKKTSKKKKVKK
jgi:hypothetical protein